MKRKIAIGFFILAVISILIWGIASRGSAQSVRFWPNKILNKLDEVLANQKEILKEIASLKERIESL